MYLELKDKLVIVDLRTKEDVLNYIKDYDEDIPQLDDDDCYFLPVDAHSFCLRISAICGTRLSKSPAPSTMSTSKSWVRSEERR